MKNITDLFKQVYQPKKALVVYQSEEKEEDIYIEAYDIGLNGKPINAHPLSALEMAGLAGCLNTSSELKQDFLKPRGLLPSHLLYINPRSDGYGVWYTPPQNADLLFVDDLNIPSGKAAIPALIWKADKNKLYVFAVKGSRKPDVKTGLYHAPFFNLYATGNVCMGTVDTDFSSITCLEDFIKGWQQYFFNSYFSHMITQVSPVEGNIVQLWQQLVNTGNPFPAEILKKNGKTVKDLIV
jgi:PRTRC genetic system protein B